MNNGLLEVFILISSNDNFILIDNGRKNSENKLKSNINDFLGDNKLSCLILTYTHFENAENGAKIKNFYKCPVIVHKSEAEYLNGGIVL